MGAPHPLLPPIEFQPVMGVAQPPPPPIGAQLPPLAIMGVAAQPSPPIGIIDQLQKKQQKIVNSTLKKKLKTVFTFDPKQSHRQGELQRWPGEQGFERTFSLR